MTTLTKEVVIDQITMIENKTILWRETTVVYDDGKELSRTYVRSSVSPFESLDDRPEVPNDVKAMANIFWTPEVIANAQATLEQSLANAGSLPNPPAV